MPRKKMISRSQSVGFYDRIDEYIQAVADERFNGNFNQAANFIAKLGVDADKAAAPVREGKSQVDLDALRSPAPEAAHA